MKPHAALIAIGLLAACTVYARDVAFVNVNVVTMAAEEILEERTVIVADGRVSRIGGVEDTVIPEDATIVDGTDRYLMPGLAEMHGHVPDASSASLERVLTLYVVNGVTSVRGMLGQPSHLELREQLAAGEVLGPRLFTSGPSFNGNSVSSPAQAATMVREQARAGYDFLKIHPGLTEAEFEAIATTAHEEGIRFAGHVPADVGVMQAMELGISTIDHLDGYMQTLIPRHEDPTGGVGGFFGVRLAGIAEAERIGAVAAATHKAGVWNVPTQTLFENVVGPDDPATLSNRPEMKYMPEATVEEWAARKRDAIGDGDFDRATADRAIELRRRLILELHRRGAELLLGSDAPQIFNVPGFSIHRELALLVAAGLTPYEALVTGTVNPARWFGAGASRGTVAVGQDADLVLLNDDPLADIRNSRRVYGVMIRGRWLGRAELDRLLDRYAESP